MRIKETQTCTISIGPKSFSQLSNLLRAYSTVFVLVDENTKQQCWPLLEPSILAFAKPILIQIPSGEIHKNIKSCEFIWQKLIDYTADRNSLLLNVGGGVICDMGAFAASTFKRGISYANIPTSLLAQVDASIGGKTGINFQLLKNQIGTFSLPLSVIVNPVFLKTLPRKEWLCGYAEMVKHALIHSKPHWEEIKNMSEQLSSYQEKGKVPYSTAFVKLISASIQIKQQIVAQDPYERGMRKILNFGHTIGHAVESLSLEKDSIPLTHGEAIAIGILCETYLSEKICGLSKEEAHAIVQCIISTYKPYNLLGFTDKLLHLVTHDKKAMNKSIRFSLLNSIGEAVIDKECSLDLIQASLTFYMDQIQ